MKKKMSLFFVMMMLLMMCTAVAHAATPSTLYYKAHVADKGWLPDVVDGQTAGTTGQNRKMEAVNIRITYGGVSGITYRAHVKDLGWMEWKSSSQTAGTTGQNRRMEAIQIKLQNGMEKLYDVYYRVHVENDGWLPWMKNGETAGTVGKSKQMEALQIKITSKETRIGRDGSITHVKAENKSGWQYPVTNAVCTWNNKTNMSWSGYSYSSSRGGRTDHSGIDIASASGDKNIYAAAGGIVERADRNSENGNYVVIRHNVGGKTVYSFYAHLSSYCVSSGQNVAKGSKIGVIGNSGLSSKGTHLHFAVVDKFWPGNYYGYVPGFSGNRTSYGGVTYYNPVYVIQNNKLP